MKKTITQTVRYSVDPEDLQPAIDYIKANYASNPSLADIAATCSRSMFHFHRLFKLAFETTPRAMVQALQFDDAKRRLMAGEKLADIAAATGFASSSHLCSQFKKKLGMTPGKWKEQQANSNNPTP